MKVVFTSDWHLGLVTSDIDRTEEIMTVLKQIAKHTIELSKEEETCLVLGGDLFNDSNPSERLIGCLLTFLNYFFDKNIKVYVVVGNHETINNPDNLSCLSFIKKLKKGYGYVKLIEDIQCFKMGVKDTGPIYFTFYPHINKAHLRDSKYETTQDYIDGKTRAIVKKVGVGSHNYIFSHLNVKDILPSSEENLLKKSKVYLPDELIMSQEPLDGSPKPLIIQGHIHARRTLHNLEVVGSPIYTDFSDTEEHKYFCVVHISDSISKSDVVEFIKIKDCRKFHDIEVNLVEHEGDVEKALNLDHIGKNDVVKLSVTVNENYSAYDWEALRSKVNASTGAYIKPITPKILMKRVKRNPEQTIDLKPEEAVKTWFRAYNHERRKERYKLAKSFL
jgi:DNA repair exonuclease SbcCD nuclease subunit